MKLDNEHLNSNEIKEYDRVILTVEKEKYTKEGVHKGMDGWVFEVVEKEDKKIHVCFDQYGALPNIAEIAVDREDLKLCTDPRELNWYDKIKDYYENK